MGFIRTAIDAALWDIIETCAKENNIDTINIRHLMCCDSDKFYVDNKVVKPILQTYSIPDIPLKDFKAQINKEIQEKKANAIILGRVNYDPFFEPITAEMWFGRMEDVDNVYKL